MMPSHRPQACPVSRRTLRAGLSRGEVLWTLALVVAVVFAIVGSHGADRRARDLREVEDELRYLAGQISFALSKDPEFGESWPDSLRSEGSIESAWQDTKSLAEHLGEKIFLPADPEGRAYLLRRTGPRAWLLGAASEDGDYFSVEDPEAIQEAKDRGIALDIRMP